MKYEEILAWRQNVHEQTVLAAQLVSRLEYGTDAPTPKVLVTTARSATSAAQQQPSLPPKQTAQDLDKDWPLLPSLLAEFKERRKSLPLPGYHSPADTSSNEHQDLKLRRVPRHGEQIAFVWMTPLISIADPVVKSNPLPVPASLAPAQGHATPKILKRPVSGSFSTGQGQSKSPMYNITESAALRTRSSTLSTMDPSDLSAPGTSRYALALATESSALMTDRTSLEEEDSGPITPGQKVSAATPRIMTSIDALSSMADLRDDQNSAQCIESPALRVRWAE